MRYLPLAAAVFSACIFASAAAPESNPYSAGKPRAALLSHLERHTNRIRARRCWRAIPVAARAAALPPAWRAVVLKRWVQRHRVAHRLRDRCPNYPLHIRGWLCIHGGEGAWDSQTGNGYYGGLQMTYGWMGLVANAALLSPLQQMWAAETGYRRSGYSSAWLSGQWPNTYPPCAGYF